MGRVASLSEGVGFGPPVLDPAVEPVFPVLAQPEVTSTPMLCRSQPRLALDALTTAAGESVPTSLKLSGPQSTLYTPFMLSTALTSLDTNEAQQSKAATVGNLEALLTGTSISGNNSTAVHNRSEACRTGTSSYSLLKGSLQSAVQHARSELLAHTMPCDAHEHTGPPAARNSMSVVQGRCTVVGGSARGD
jgi:hypothetical protein